jgi:hypothetical protein
MVRSEDENVLEILKTGAGKGWKGSVGPIVWEMWKYYKEPKRRGISYTLKRRNVNWIGRILCRNRLLKYVSDGKTEGRIEVTGRWRWRSKQLLDDLEEKRGFYKLKEETSACTHWRIRCGRGYGPVIRQAAEWTALCCTNHFLYVNIDTRACVKSLMKVWGFCEPAKRLPASKKALLREIRTFLHVGFPIHFMKVYRALNSSVRSRYSDSLQAGWSGDIIPVWARFSTPAQTDPVSHPTSNTIGTGSSPG